MKSILLGLFSLFISVGAFAQSTDSVWLFSYFVGNGEDGLHLAHSADGFTWNAIDSKASFLKPVLSPDKLMRDPCIIRGKDNRFHMVWTVSWTQRGIGYASSPDLLNWSEQQYIPVMEHEAKARNTWAPEITYDPVQDEYMIYWATTITGTFPETQVQEDNAYNHRMYYVTTKDFKTFSDTKLLYEPGFNCIDASIVPYNAGWLMFIKDETRVPAQKNLKIAFADKLTGPYSAASAPITGKYWAEGPTVTKINGLWTVYFDKYTEHKYGAIQSANLKTWVDVSDKVQLPKGLRHGTVFQVSKAELQKILSAK
ncbi:glycoside hydrolase family 43 protein [Sphingobacterium bambusae]|uniref:Glycoside hydrolase family 43 protein n=1 Tax=Sphingobacterium bambusae TaxID=662858 RepID=A0ABW6BJ35_9SPHI|nr:glycoside hydrolase family 43 protein [Sphingobacterium bambusae]WPL46703.1 glycoside hydrolase family 43 protein [Sphingobacterium bambusae]